MYNIFQLSFKYLIFWVKASSGKGHGIHSPFVYDFIRSVLRGKNADRSRFQKIEIVREKFLQDQSSINILDLGAGSGSDNSKERSIASIAKTAAKPVRFGRLFYRIITHYNIENVLELGTSLGLSTRYFAEAEPQNGVFTIEGAPELANYTKLSLQREGYRNVKLLEGDFSNLLPQVLPQLRGRKLIFVDGNHRYEPTVAYFLQSMEHIQAEDILIFDDIHWSPEMEKAWEEIKNHQQVSCTIDLFFIGIVFFRKEFKEKSSFSIRF